MRIGATRSVVVILIMCRTIFAGYVPPSDAMAHIVILFFQYRSQFPGIGNAYQKILTKSLSVFQASSVRKAGRLLTLGPFTSAANGWIGLVRVVIFLSVSCRSFLPGLITSVAAKRCIHAYGTTPPTGKHFRICLLSQLIFVLQKV